MGNEEQRLLSKVTKVGDCWVFNGTKRPGGYGVIYFRKKSTLAHRASYMLFRGPIAPGMDICHHCDVRDCVNPDHLFMGTRQDNMRDCVSKGRNTIPKHNKLKTHCVRGHEYTAENTWVNARGWRWCKACNREKVLRLYHGAKNRTLPQAAGILQ